MEYLFQFPIKEKKEKKKIALDDYIYNRILKLMGEETAEEYAKNANEEEGTESSMDFDTDEFQDAEDKELLETMKDDNIMSFHKENENKNEFKDENNTTYATGFPEFPIKKQYKSGLQFEDDEIIYD